MKLKGSSFGTLDQIQWPSQTQIKWTAALQNKQTNKNPTNSPGGAQEDGLEQDNQF